ncbi:DNA repair protein RAD51 [Citrus sinensis]|uniref:DNA repair protein RAD51 n=1 Tax=Citrus sinensis TaxID=2711 RepID=A0ACB8IX86_CITSI|nr:DNA repair protein RAD51 [Citrus sinensis]
MANKLISEMRLPKSIANIFAARNITTAKASEFLLKFHSRRVVINRVRVNEITRRGIIGSQIRASSHERDRVSTALLLMEQRAATEHLGGHLPTRLKGLDAALCGGVPFGVVTELFCLKLSLLAALPAHYGGLDGGVIYIDVESTFSSRRMIEMGASSFPEIFHSKGMAQEMAGRILVLQPTSLSEFTERGHEQRAPGQHPLSWHISLITSLAEFSRIPIVVTNQVRPQSHDESCLYPFQVQKMDRILKDRTRYYSHIVAVLGFHWAHAVTIRLVLEAKSGQRFMNVEKSPTSPPLAFSFTINPSGISLLTDDGTEMVVPETCNLSSSTTVLLESHISMTNFAGCSDIIEDGEKLH